MLKIKFFGVFVMIMLAAFVIKAQDTPSDVRDLVGSRASSGDSELRKRGYNFVKTTEGSDRKWSNWWKQSTKTCITVATVNGRFDSIVSSPAFDCNRDGNNNNNNDDGRKITPPRWAQGTFYGTAPNGTQITLNISRDGNVTASTSGSTSYGSFTRGNYLRIAGARALVTRQGSNIATTNPDNGERIVYSRNGGGGNTSGGGSDQVNVQDLVGVRASSGEAEMKSRGFRLVDSFKSGNTSYTIWWRKPSSQCIQVAVADGRYDSISDIGTHPQCR